MLRPHDGPDLRAKSCELDVAPQLLQLRSIQEVFGNSVAIAAFDERTDRLRFTSTITIDDRPAEQFALTPDDVAYFYPFPCNEKFPDLRQFVTPNYSNPNGELLALARTFSMPKRRPMFKKPMTHGIRNQLAYRTRHEAGTQHALDTPQTGSGTRHDCALLMLEALRWLGIAARFVSGHLFTGDGAHEQGGSTHARVAGWIEFDPTNGITGFRDLIRVAVARDTIQAVPPISDRPTPSSRSKVSLSVVSLDEEVRA